MFLENDSVRVEIDLAQGGRISSLCIDEMELIVGSAEDTLDWGCYPMAPWARVIFNLIRRPNPSSY